jgi:hypothetical protein
MNAYVNMFIFDRETYLFVSLLLWINDCFTSTSSLSILFRLIILNFLKFSFIYLFSGN